MTAPDHSTYVIPAGGRLFFMELDPAAAREVARWRGEGEGGRGDRFVMQLLQVVVLDKLAVGEVGTDRMTLSVALADLTR